MIKINLLPVKRRKKPKPIPSFLILAGVLLVVSTVVAVYANQYFTSRVDLLNKQKMDNENKIKELDEKIKDVNDFKKRNETFQKKRDAIEALSKSQALPARILDEISIALADGVWIRDMDIKGITDISLSGSGFTNPDIVTFVENLKKSDIFSEVNLLETSSAGTAEEVVYQFSVTIKMKGSEPPAAAQPGAAPAKK